MRVQLGFYQTCWETALLVFSFATHIFSLTYFQEFCNFDDYNWDWTLQHLSHKCIPGTMKVLKMKATRVFHMGDWLVYAMHEQICLTIFILISSQSA